MDKIKEMLDDTIKSEIQKINSMATGSDVKTKAIDDVSKLYRLRIEEEKIETEQETKKYELNLKEDSIKLESYYKDDVLKSQFKDRWIGMSVQVGLAICGWLAYDIWLRRGLKFEETGMVTSPLTKNLMSKMLPKK